MLTIKKIEQENDREIALLEEQITAYLAKAGANRTTQIANAEEALNMANSLGIIYPTTLEALAQKARKILVRIRPLTFRINSRCHFIFRGQNI